MSNKAAIISCFAFLLSFEANGMLLGYTIMHFEIVSPEVGGILLYPLFIAIFFILLLTEED